MCYGGLGILLEARRWGFPMEHGGISVHVCCVARQRQQMQSAGLLSHLFLFTSLFWSLLEHEVHKKHSSVGDLVRPMMMKRTRRWHWLVFCWCLGFLHMFSVLTVNVYVQLGLLNVKYLLDYTYLSRQTYRPFASALNYFFLSNASLILHFCFVCSSATSESLWYFELLTYLRPHFCANDVYMVVRCITMQLICLLSVSSPC